MMPPKHKSKSVHFDSATKEAEEEANNNLAQKSHVVDLQQPLHTKKRSRNDRKQNQDEMDDIDDWVPDEEEDELVEGLPTEKQKLEAKRARREKQRHGGELDDEEEGIESTKIDRTTSLSAEGIPVEPFHMENEKSDGTGYFDGDTYVFRKRGDDDEPDAWLDGLKDSDQFSGKTIEDDESSNDDDAGEVDKQQLTKEKMYAKILPLLGGDKENIMQAVIRYGELLKRGKPSHNKTKKKGKDEVQAQSSSESWKAAQTSLNDLTEAANTLLNLGDVDIYQKTRNDLASLVPQKAQAKSTSDISGGALGSTSDSSHTMYWEYKGIQDGKIRKFLFVIRLVSPDCCITHQCLTRSTFHHRFIFYRRTVHIPTNAGLDSGWILCGSTSGTNSMHSSKTKIGGR